MSPLLVDIVIGVCCSLFGTTVGVLAERRFGVSDIPVGIVNGVLKTTGESEVTMRGKGIKNKDVSASGQSRIIIETSQPERSATRQVKRGDAGRGRNA